MLQEKGNKQRKRHTKALKRVPRRLYKKRHKKKLLNSDGRLKMIGEDIVLWIDQAPHHPLQSGAHEGHWTRTMDAKTLNRTANKG